MPGPSQDQLMKVSEQIFFSFLRLYMNKDELNRLKEEIAGSVNATRQVRGCVLERIQTMANFASEEKARLSFKTKSKINFLP